MFAVFQQVAILLIFCVAGYVLCKLHIGDVDQTKLLSVLEVYVFGPCLTISSFSKNFNVDYIKAKYPLLIAGTVLVLVLYFATRPLAKKLSIKPYNQNIYHYNLVTSNTGYVGYPLCVGILGQEALLDFIIFTLPFSFYISTIGFSTLTNQSSGHLNLRKVLLTPPVIACVIGAAIGLSGWQMPYILGQVVTQSGACMAPVSMLMTGMTISQYDFKTLLSNKKAYLVSALRLLLIPAAASLVMKGLAWVLPMAGLPGLGAAVTSVTTIAIMMLCLPCGMNTIIYPRMVGEDCKIGASTVLISTVAALGTIPLCVTFLM